MYFHWFFRDKYTGLNDIYLVFLGTDIGNQT